MDTDLNNKRSLPDTINSSNKRQKSEDTSESAETSNSYTDDEDEDEEWIDNETYFEKDDSQIRETIIEHILDELTADQRAALRKKITHGVNRAFTLCNHLTKDLFDQLSVEEPTRNLWKLGMGPKDIKKYSKKLAEQRNAENPVKRITLKRILDSSIDTERKKQAVRLFDSLQSSQRHSYEYNELVDTINNLLEQPCKNFTVEQLEQYSKKEVELRTMLDSEIPLRLRILSADMDDKRKAAIYEKYLLYLKKPPSSDTAASLEEWIEEALKTPFKKVANNFDLKNSGTALIKLKEGFNEHLSEMDSVLEPLLTIFNNRMHQPDSSSLVIGLLGSPGVGKTKTGQIIANVWGLPFHQISLGGVMDASILDGQHPGWVGSSPGRFTKALQEMGVINGVLFLDEVDKLGETHHGLQVQYSLLHCTDPVQNNNYHDHYLGSNLPLDLSKCLIICALNKTTGLDSALLNRMHIIKVPDYTANQKTRILMKHLFPEALENAGLTTEQIELPLDMCSFIQSQVESNIGKEGGVRGIKSCIKMIVDKIALLLRTTKEEQGFLNLTFKVDTSNLPIKITSDIVEQLYDIKGSNTTWSRMYI